MNLEILHVEEGVNDCSMQQIGIRPPQSFTSQSQISHQVSESHKYFTKTYKQVTCKKVPHET